MRRMSTPTTKAGDTHAALPRYVAAMTGRCPYLQRSMAEGLTTWAGVEAGPDDGPDLLALLVEAAEDIRTQRRRRGPLVCANVAAFGPRTIAEARAVLDWPHWIARNLYAPVQLMIGKFWIGEIEDDKHGLSIAPPPVSFLSIRHSFATKDSRFLATMPTVSAALADACDDGRDVLAPWLERPTSGEAVRDAYAELVALFPAEGANR